LTEVQDKIELVKAEMLRRFPDANYTVKVLLWDDDTYLVECRHGRHNENGGVDTHNIQWYDDEVHYEINECRSNAIVEDEYGTQFYVPNELIPHLSQRTKEKLKLDGSETIV